MEQSSVYDEESFLEIEVLRKQRPFSSPSLATLVPNSNEGSVSSRRACRDHRTANNAKRDINLRDGCCHSTPLQEKTTENTLLNEFFSRILLSVVSVIKITIPSYDKINTILYHEIITTTTLQTYRPQFHPLSVIHILNKTQQSQIMFTYIGQLAKLYWKLQRPPTDLLWTADHSTLK